MTSRSASLVRIGALLACGMASLGAQAQFKVVGPDGRVTYSDRPPAAASGAQVSNLRGGSGGPAPASAPLPLELRQAVTRFPVVLYTAPDCAPCDSARQLLQTRGVPYSEKRILNDADGDALARLSDSRTVPTLTVGKQVLRGFAGTDWNSTLDLAGYPRTSRLPAGYQASAPEPLTQRQPDPAPAAAAAAPRAEARPEPTEAPASGPNIRF